MNFLKVTFLMTLLVLLFAGVGYFIGGRTGFGPGAGAVVALVFAIALNFFSYWYSDKLVLKMYRAREVTEADNPRLVRVVRRVTTAALLPMPRVYVVPSRAPNAFATGRNAEHAAVAATEGLLAMLDEEELEGVIGHEIAHIQNNDMLIGTIAATFAGAIGTLSFFARWGAVFGGMGSRDGERGSPLELLAIAIVAPLAAFVIQSTISRQREYKADARGGEITGKYRGLASALAKLHRSPVQMRLDAKPATANLMIVNPLSGKGLSNLFSTHPPVEKRIAKLKELAQQAPYR